MAGKSYSKREMKTIVKHIIDTKAYSDTKGRKMWVDFANSKNTQRTWQSLKETFIKSILPDLTNPYYSLTDPQIISIRAGYDVITKQELVEVTSDSDLIENNYNATDKSNTTDMQPQNGEDHNSKSTKSQNGSANTAAIDQCYEDAEAIIRDLESPKVTNERNNTSKSLRDCISYSEPLTPMLQEVLHDFTSESEEDNALQIDESNNNEKSDNVEVATNGDTVQHDTELPSNVSTEVHPKQSEELTVGTNVAEPNEVGTISPNNDEINDATQNQDSNNSFTAEKNNKEENPLTQNQDSNNCFTAKNTKQVIETISSESQNVATLSKEVNQYTSLPNNQEGLHAVDTTKLSQSILHKPKTKLNTKKSNKTSIISKKDSKEKPGPSNATKSNNKKKSVKEVAATTSNNNEQNNKTEIPTKLPDTEVIEISQSAEASNPCLQNVSLFENLLNSYQSDSSDSSEARTDSKEVARPTRSDSDTERVLELSDNTHTAYYTNGGSRRNKNASRRRSFPKNNKHNAQNRILSLEEEGGLFVMYENKLYPLVKDGRLVSNYVTYLPECKEICSRKKIKSQAATVVPEKQLVGETTAEKVTIKLTLNTKNTEVVVEGVGSQVSSVLEQVMHLLNRDSAVTVGGAGGDVTGRGPSVHGEVQQKIDKMEEEIFKEIQAMDAEEQDVAEDTHASVTKRKGQPITSLSEAGSSEKHTKLAQKETDSSSKSVSTRENGIPRVSPEVLKESTNCTSETILTKEDRTTVEHPPKTKTKLQRNRRDRNKPQKSLHTPTLYSSLDNLTIDSTQGYQDSDVSPIVERRKKRRSLSAMSKARRSSKRASPHMHYDASDDSPHSDEPTTHVARHNSTLNTSVYRSESYQLLMPVVKTNPHLQPIEETNRFDDNLTSDENSLSLDHCNGINSSPSPNLGSPNILTLSPEVSIIEKSISRDIERDNDNIPACNKYLMSVEDVPMSLTQEECDLDRCLETSISLDPKSIVTESLIRNIGTFDLEDKVPATDRLDEKLRDLLLKSARKMDLSNNNNIMTIEGEVKKTAACKKICSTPRRKKRPISKKTLVHVESEQEHAEYSAQAGLVCPLVNETLEAFGEDNILKMTEKPRKQKKDIIKVKIVRPAKSKESLDSARTASRISTYPESGSTNKELQDGVGVIHNDHSETLLVAAAPVDDSVQLVETNESVITLDDSINDVL